MDVGVLFGVVGISVGVYFGLENRRLNKGLRTFDWPQIESGVRYLSTLIEQEYQPDLIVCSSAGSVGVVANLYVTYTPRFVPLYMGVSRSKVGSAFTSSPLFPKRYETNRWETFLPDGLAATGARKVLILEDVVLSGETMREIVSLLIEEGFTREQIKTAALFGTSFGANQGQAPDFYWRELPDTDFYLPWGRSLGKGHQRV
ncbi:MAG: phosphoribosyltransferase domain-containing protein [Actinomycetota bacterium]|nr:phosphoribosyltransferase domain-containing protein [Actinomycetota bacterium]